MERGLTEEKPNQYYVEDIEKLWIEYDHQTDTLYIYFADKNEEPEEALLVGENVIVGLKDNRLLSITINEFSRRIGLERY